MKRINKFTENLTMTEHAIDIQSKVGCSVFKAGKPLLEKGKRIGLKEEEKTKYLFTENRGSGHGQRNH